MSEDFETKLYPNIEVIRQRHPNANIPSHLRVTFLNGLVPEYGDLPQVFDFWDEASRVNSALTDPLVKRAARAARSDHIRRELLSPEKHRKSGRAVLYVPPDNFDGSCYWHAPRNCAIGQVLFPNMVWHVVKSPSYSTAIGMDESRMLCMDQRWGETHMADIWEAVRGGEWVTLEHEIEALEANCLADASAKVGGQVKEVNAAALAV